MKTDTALLHLQHALKAKTISYSDRTRIDFKEYEMFISHLKKDYPLLHKKANVERVETYSLIYHLKGSDSRLKPLAMMGHYDVVPVREEKWTMNPFGAEVKEGYVYGRGALDMKGHVIALLEAVESLLEEGYDFKRDVYLLFGHNEETGSSANDSGAMAIQELLKSRGIEFYSVMDEGGAFIDGKPLGIEGLVAVIGTAEKGYLDVQLSAKSTGGHASMPPEKSALYNVFEAAMKMESDKFKADLNPATDAMFESLVPYMKFPHSFIFKNRAWLKPILLNLLIKNPTTAAIVRTTSVMTMAEGSKAPNVLAQEGKVVINCRIVPGDSVEATLKRIQDRVGPNIEVKALLGTNPTSVSPKDHPAFTIIQNALKQVYPEFVAVAPYLMVAATDSRIYHGMAEGVYRVQPFKSSYEDLHTVHADNERVELDSFYKGIEFFKRILKDVSQ